MQQIVPFVINHWYLVLLGFILLSLIIFYEIYPDGAGVKSLSPQEVVLLMNHQNIVLLDTRNETLFNEGHIIGALRYDAAKPDVKAQKKLEKAKDKPIILYCATGAEAAKVAQQLQKQEFTQVAVLRGGLQAWYQAGLPLNKEKEKEDATNT